MVEPKCEEEEKSQKTPGGARRTKMMVLFPLVIRVSLGGLLTLP